MKPATERRINWWKYNEARYIAIPKASIKDYLYFLWIYLPYILIGTLCVVSTCLALTALLSGL
jgi:hypothetical protein